eukprot:TRINITY_DN652_c0_g2_i1.p1 TRINITY_DN652_c0_g2~~TRINITY_DN652_c0_g2_i1.p1  ORF type:complete len:366 (+),score=55.05 TRINITY_DN652_c0_g2_i1:410-1507(+)
MKILILYLFITFVLSHKHDHGINPSQLFLYQGDHFVCDGGVLISIESVNDDYCDCQDGSDEPGTSACKEGVFYCRNEGFYPESIYASLVNDGVCDCCDGSDEYLTGLCPNTCQALGREEKIVLQQKVSDIKEALRIKREGVEKILSDVSVNDDRIKEITSEIESLNADLESIKLMDGYIEQKYSKNSYKLIRSDGIWNNIKRVVKYPFESVYYYFYPTVMHRYNAVKEKILSLEKEIEDLNFLSKVDFGDNYSYSPLYQQHFTLSLDKYKYHFHPFQKVLQDSTVLGKSFSWVDDTYTTMLFENGQHCWNHGARSSKANMICGKTNKILDVKETNRCEYELNFQTPYACNTTHLKNTEKKLSFFN